MNVTTISTDVRAWGLTNTNRPSELLAVMALAMLAGDEDEEVRKKVGSNPNTPVEVLSQLAGDRQKTVRIQLAGNPNTPVEVLAQLAGDEAKYVRLSVVHNPSTPAMILTMLAGDEDEVVRFGGGCVSPCPGGSSGQTGQGQGRRGANSSQDSS